MKNIYLHDMEVGILFVHNRTVLKYANVTKELIKHTWTCAEIIKGVATDSCSNSMEYFQLLVGSYPIRGGLRFSGGSCCSLIKIIGSVTS